jgi:hypothetical protein
MALLAALVLAPVAAADPTPAQAIANLNAWRTEVGEQPVSTTDIAAWDTGCQHANNYNHVNGLLTHQEMMGNGNGYTADGAEAASDSVLGEAINSGGPTADDHLLPGPVWDGAVFHRAALLQPRLANTGFDSSTYQDSSNYTTFVCMWVLNQGSDPPSPQALDQTRTTPNLTLYPSPANGTVDVPTRFPGNEGPDPATETGVPPGATLGWLMNVEINGPWQSSYFASAHGVAATLAPDGSGTTVPLVVSECGPSGCGASGGTSYGLYFDGGFGIFPTQPLAANTMYHVAATGTVTDFSTSKDYPFSISWCFSTGSKFTPSTDCSRPASGLCGVEAVLPDTGGTQSSCGSTTPPGGGKAGPPRVSGSSLSIGKHGKLGFSVHAGSGAPGIKSIAISLPHGLSFSGKSSSLRKGVSSHTHATLKVHRGVLTAGLSPAIASLKLSVGNPALKVAKALQKRHKHKQHLTVVVRVTDAAGKTTTFKLKFSVR